MALGMSQMNLGVVVTPYINQQALNGMARAAGTSFASNFQNASSRSSQPLGRITGQVSEFERSMAAANARVLAFGASAGSIYLVKDAFSKMVGATIEVEKALADINAVLNLGQTEIKNFSTAMFKAASQTGQTFQTASKIAIEFARHGVSATETTKRMSSAMQLMRISGMSAGDSVNAITAAINAFNKEGLTSEDIVNRLTAVDTKFAVSSQDLAKAIQRVGSTAVDAGVRFNELLGLVTAVQTATARGGAVIGNAFKSIFTRLARPEVIGDLEAVGVKTKDAYGQVLPMVEILKRLAAQYDHLNYSQKSFISEAVGGVYQVNILKASLADLGRGFSIYDKAVITASQSTGQIEKRMAMLNDTISAKVNTSVVQITRLFSSFGQTGFGVGAKGGLDTFNKQIEAMADSLDDSTDGSGIGEKIGKSIAQGITKGLGDIISGPGVQMAAALIAKLAIGLTKFAYQSGREVMGLNEPIHRQKALQQSIQTFMQSNVGLVNLWARGQLNLNTLTAIYLRNLQQANILQQRIANVSTASAASAMGGVSFTPASPARGFMPSFRIASEEEAILERRLAASHNSGYRSGPVVPKVIWDGKGGARLTKVNQAESVQEAVVGGHRGTKVTPPNGFGLGTMYAASGFIPSFATITPEILSSFSSGKEMLKYVNSLNVAGDKGSSRMFIPMGDGKGMKIALNKAGIAQNEVEFPILNSDYFAQQNYSDILPKGYGYDENNFLWGVMEQLRKPTNKDFQKIIGAGRTKFLSTYRRKLSPVEEQVREFSQNYGIIMGDFQRGRNTAIGPDARILGRLREGATRGGYFADFYDKYEAANPLQGADRDNFNKIYAGQSRGTDDRLVFGTSVKIFKGLREGKTDFSEELFSLGQWKGRAATMKKFLAGEELTTEKTGAYYKALSGDKGALAIDRNVINTALGYTVKKGDKTSANFRQRLRELITDKLSPEMNLDPRAIQASLFAGRSKFKPSFAHFSSGFAQLAAEGFIPSFAKKSGHRDFAKIMMAEGDTRVPITKSNSAFLRNLAGMHGIDSEMSPVEIVAQLSKRKPKLFSKLWLGGLLSYPQVAASGAMPSFSLDAISEAFKREGTPTATLGSDPKLKSPSNPMGLGVYDKSYQSSLQDAFKQHISIGQTDLKGMGKNAASGYVPSFGIMESIVLGTLQGTINNLNGVLAPLTFGYSKQLESIRKLNESYVNFSTQIKAGSHIKYGGRTYDDADIVQNLRNFSRDFRRSNAGFSASPALQAGQSQVYENYSRRVQDRQRRISGIGTYGMIGGPIAGEIGASLAKSFGAINMSKGLEEFSSGLTMSGQLLSAFPNKLGVALSAGTMFKSLSDSISIAESKFGKFQKAYDLATTRSEKLKSSGDALLESFERMRNAASDATITLAEYNAIQLRHAKALVDLGSTPADSAGKNSGRELVARIAGGENPAVVMADATNRQNQEKTNLGIITQLAQLKAKGSIFGFNYHETKPGGLLSYTNEMDKKEKESLTREATSSIFQDILDIGKLPEGFKERMTKTSLRQEDVNTFLKEAKAKSDVLTNVGPNSNTGKELLGHLEFELNKFKVPAGVKPEEWEKHMKALNLIRVKEMAIRRQYNAELQNTLAKGSIMTNFVATTGAGNIESEHRAKAFGTFRETQAADLTSLTTAEIPMIEIRSRIKEKQLRNQMDRELALHKNKGAETIGLAVSGAVKDYALEGMTSEGRQGQRPQINETKAARLKYITDRQMALAKNPDELIKGATGSPAKFVEMLLGKRSVVSSPDGEGKMFSDNDYDVLSSKISTAMMGQSNNLTQILVGTKQITEKGLNDLQELGVEQVRAIKEARFKELAAGIKGTDELQRGGARKLRRELRRDEYIVNHSRSVLRRGEAARDLLNYIPSDQRDYKNPQIKKLYDTAVSGTEAAYNYIYRGTSLEQYGAGKERAEARIFGQYKGRNTKDLGETIASGKEASPIDTKKLELSVTVAGLYIDRFGIKLDSIGASLDKFKKDIEKVDKEKNDEQQKYSAFVPPNEKNKSLQKGDASWNYLKDFGMVAGTAATTIASMLLFKKIFSGGSLKAVNAAIAAATANAANAAKASALASGVTATGAGMAGGAGMGAGAAGGAAAAGAAAGAAGGATGAAGGAAGAAAGAASTAGARAGASAARTAARRTAPAVARGLGAAIQAGPGSVEALLGKPMGDAILAMRRGYAGTPFIGRNMAGQLAGPLQRTFYRAGAFGGTEVGLGTGGVSDAVRALGRGFRGEQFISRAMAGQAAGGLQRAAFTVGTRLGAPVARMGQASSMFYSGMSGATNLTRAAAGLGAGSASGISRAAFYEGRSALEALRTARQIGAPLTRLPLIGRTMGSKAGILSPLIGAAFGAYEAPQEGYGRGMGAFLGATTGSAYRGSMWGKMGLVKQGGTTDTALGYGGAMLNGAIAGGIIGTMVGGPVGTAVGAGIGTVVGGVAEGVKHINAKVNEYYASKNQIVSGQADSALLDMKRASFDKNKGELTELLKLGDKASPEEVARRNALRNALGVSGDKTMRKANEKNAGEMFAKKQDEIRQNLIVPSQTFERGGKTIGLTERTSSGGYLSRTVFDPKNITGRQKAMFSAMAMARGGTELSVDEKRALAIKDYNQEQTQKRQAEIQKRSQYKESYKAREARENAEAERQAAVATYNNYGNLAPERARELAQKQAAQQAAQQKVAIPASGQTQTSEAQNVKITAEPATVNVKVFDQYGKLLQEQQAKIQYLEEKINKLEGTPKPVAANSTASP